MTEKVERIGDMGEGLKLRLYKQNDGDIIVSVTPVNERFGDGVEFCSSGTQSRRTWRALVALFSAMEADEAERPQSAAGGE